MKVKISVIAVLIIGLIISGCGQEQVPEATLTPLPTATPPPIATPTPTSTPTFTPKPTYTPPPTATPNLAATQQYESFLLLVQEYFDAGYIPSTTGKYKRLADFSDSFAKAEYYQFTEAENKAASFIVRSDVIMETVNQTFPRAGCGYAYHIVPEFDNQNEVMFLSLNGNAYSYRIEYNALQDTSNYYGEISNPGEAELTLVVNKATAYILVNGKLVAKNVSVMGDFQNNFSWRRDWGFAVISGSDEDFGTRCTFKNIDFWEAQQ